MTELSIDNLPEWRVRRIIDDAPVELGRLVLSMMFSLWTPDGASSRRSMTEAIVRCRKLVGDHPFTNAFIRVRDADRTVALDHPQAFAEVGQICGDAIDLANPNLKLTDGHARMITGFHLETSAPCSKHVVTTIYCLRSNVPTYKRQSP